MPRPEPGTTANPPQPDSLHLPPPHVRSGRLCVRVGGALAQTRRQRQGHVDEGHLRNVLRRAGVADVDAHGLHMLLTAHDIDLDEDNVVGFDDFCNFPQKVAETERARPLPRARLVQPPAAACPSEPCRGSGGQAGNSVGPDRAWWAAVQEAERQRLLDKKKGPRKVRASMPGLFANAREGDHSPPYA